jgi:hypothetical protein
MISSTLNVLWEGSGDETGKIALLFSTPATSSLVGHTGGALSTSTTVRPLLNALGWSLISGSLTEIAATPVPEPSSPRLLSAFAGAGLAGLVGKRPLPQRTA